MRFPATGLGYLLLGVIGAMVIATVPLLAPKGTLAGAGGVLAFTASTGVAVAWGLFLALKAHRALDEYQRERARRAVYWGTSGGIVASAPLYAFVAIGGLQRIDVSIPAGKSLAIAFAGGYGLALLSMVLGITISAMTLRHARLSAAA